MKDKTQPSSLTLETNPFEQSFASKAHEDRPDPPPQFADTKHGVPNVVLTPLPLSGSPMPWMPQSGQFTPGIAGYAPNHMMVPPFGHFAAPQMSPMPLRGGYMPHAETPQPLMAMHAQQQVLAPLHAPPPPPLQPQQPQQPLGPDDSRTLEAGEVHGGVRGGVHAGVPNANASPGGGGSGGGGSGGSGGSASAPQQPPPPPPPPQPPQPYLPTTHPKHIPSAPNAAQGPPSQVPAPAPAPAPSTAAVSPPQQAHAYARAQSPEESSPRTSPEGVRKPSDADGGDPAKRRQFLERNRIAAIRCRQRKKIYVDDLKQKVDAYAKMNEALQRQSAALHGDLQQLQQFVLQYHDARTLPPHIQQIVAPPPADAAAAAAAAAAADPAAAPDAPPPADARSAAAPPHGFASLKQEPITY